MSNEPEIRSGGRLAVDTESLRRAAAALEGAAARCADIAAELTSLAGTLPGLAPFACDHATMRAEMLAMQSDQARADAAGLARGLHAAAAAYELVELEAARTAALAAGDADLARLVAGRIVALRLTTPWDALGAPLIPVAPGGFAQRHGGLVGQWAPSPPLSPIDPLGVMPGAVGAVALSLVDRLGAGTLPRSARLTGPAPAVRVFPVPAGAARGSAPAASVPPASSAPSGLAGAVARVPSSGAARVRVERYTMADGTRQFAVYVAGTQAVGPSDTEPWDLTSNLELYGGERSAAYAATVEALRQAGAGPGDPVHAVGYSQGGMIAARLALEDEFTVATLVTFGSPVEADAGDGTLSVVVRHSDDPVAALAGEGFAAGAGAPGGFVAERHGDPLGGVADVINPLRGHDLGAYAETAGLLDASADPRMDAVRGVFAGLGVAASVDTTIYGAERAEAVRRESRPEIARHRGR